MRPPEPPPGIPPTAQFEITVDDPDPFADLPAWKQKIADVVVELAPRYSVDPAPRARGHRRRIQLRVHGALGQGCARLDAAHSGDGDALQRARCVQREGQRARRSCLPALAARVLSRPGATSRRRPTTRARRPSTSIAAFHPMRRHVTMFDAFSDCSARTCIRTMRASSTRHRSSSRDLPRGS